MTQTEQVMRHIERYGSINPQVAISRYSIYRLAARIADLREVIQIKTTLIWTPAGKRYARYSLA